MAGDSVRVFQRTDSFKFLVYLFALFMTLTTVCFLIFFMKENVLISIACTASIGVAILGFLVMATEKVIVTSDTIISENILKKRLIPFKTIKRLYVGHVRNTYLLSVTTEQLNIRLHGGASKEQLDEMANYILEKIRTNDPEHYLLINLPKYEVEDFWRQ